MNDTIDTKSGRGKRGLAILALIIGLLAVLYYAWSWNHYYRQAAERTGKDMVFMWQWKMYAEGMKVAYTEDTYGGATPEETLQLFIDALKAGDIELASKYYVPEKQGEVFVQLKQSRDKQNLNKYVEHVSNFVGGQTATATQTYFIFYKDDEKQSTYQFRFVINQISKKWKISAP